MQLKMVWKMRFTEAVFMVGALGFAVQVNAGDLNPPPGPIAPTQRTPIGPNTTPGDNDATPSLYKISTPGSYYLTGNVQGIAAVNGIEIAASGVTLDLNGFEFLGVAGSLDGVRTTVNGLTNIAVVNGSVRNWGGKGVDLATAPYTSHNCRVTDVLSSGNGGTGIFAGTNAVVVQCAVYQNGGFGIATGSGSTIVNCAAEGNTVNAIISGAGCTITNCAAANNCSAEGNAGYGIFANIGSTVVNCFSGYNTGDGILVPGETTVRNNSCIRNGSGATDGAGIHATGADNRIEGNNCTNNDRGIDVDAAGNFIARNTCSGNTINNWDIAAGNVCLVVSAITSGAIVGDSGGVAPGSTDPNVNFSY